MMNWIAANAATIIISLVLLVLTGLAIRSVYKNRGGCSCGVKGGCSGQCGGCGGCGAGHKLP